MKKRKNDPQLQLLEQLLYLSSPTNRIALPELPHEQNCSTWAPKNRIVLPELPHEQYSLHPGSWRPGKVRRVFSFFSILSFFSIFSNIFGSFLAGFIWKFIWIFEKQLLFRWCFWRTHGHRFLCFYSKIWPRTSARQVSFWSRFSNIPVFLQ